MKGFMEEYGVILIAIAFFLAFCGVLVYSDVKVMQRNMAVCESYDFTISIDVNGACVNDYGMLVDIEFLRQKLEE